MGVRTVLQLQNAEAETTRSRFSVVLERTVRELRGVSCLELDEVVSNKQQIMSSRSFGTLIYERAELEEAVATYIARAAEKLRAQDSLAGALQVYIRTNVFKPEVPQYQRSVTVPLPEPTADTRLPSQWRTRILRKIYRPGFGYHKAGITLMNLVPKAHQQFSLFAKAGGAGDIKSERLMGALDNINQKFGRSTVRVAAEGIEKSWKMRRGKVSPAYTTSWDALATVRAI